MDTKIILKDILQVCPKKTHSGRVYPKDIFQKEFKKIRMNIRKLKIRRLFFN
jgi:hypothetical protein